MGKFIRDLTFLRQIFRPQEPAGGLLSDLSDVLVPTADVLGTSRYGELDNDDAAGVNVDTVLDAVGAVPSNLVRFIPYAVCSHNDGAANKTLWLAARLTLGAVGNIDYPVSDFQTVSSTTRIWLRRPIFLPAGSQLVAKASAAVGAGITLKLNHAFVEIPVGELVRY